MTKYTLWWYEPFANPSAGSVRFELRTISCDGKYIGEARNVPGDCGSGVIVQIDGDSEKELYQQIESFVEKAKLHKQLDLSLECNQVMGLVACRCSPGQLVDVFRLTPDTHPVLRSEFRVLTQSVLSVIRQRHPDVNSLAGL